MKKTRIEKQYCNIHACIYKGNGGELKKKKNIQEEL